MQVSATGKRFDVGQSLKSHVVATSSPIVERHTVKAEISAHALVYRRAGGNFGWIAPGLAATELRRSKKQ
jgi:hypothetical protein